MLFIGTIGASPTLPQLFSDIINILTGVTTTTGGLSASFVAGTSTFYNTVAPGWTSYDAAAGSVANSVTPCVIRSAWSDDPTKYKNVYIYSLSAAQLGFNGYETWNSGSHTGTFPIKTTPAASSWQAIDFTGATYVGGKLIISASANHIYIQIYTSTGTVGPHTFFSEYSRDDPWNTVANGYPSWLQTGSFGASASTVRANMGVPRLYNSATTIDTTSGAMVMSPDVGFPAGGCSAVTAVTDSTLGSLNGATQTFPLSIVGADSSKVAAHYVYPITVRQASNVNVFTGAFLGGNLSSINGEVYYSQQSFGAALDDLTVGTDTYLLMTNTAYTSARIALKKA